MPRCRYREMASPEILKESMEEITTFLENILRNNNRPWFLEHKKEYQKAQANFNALAEQIIAGVQKFDDNCKGLR